jgi:S-adenosylmethionine:diacylglycerol 3-amino-3-carboxypropyl transferase
MIPLFDFGISQDDSRSEIQFLELKSDDRVLCLASGGEVPLDILSSSKGIQVEAVDINENQLFLTKLKLLAAVHLDPVDAAVLLGYMSGKPIERHVSFSIVKPFLKENEIKFWENNPQLFDLGPVCSGRFESYIRKYNKWAIALLGKNHLTKLMEIQNLPDQEFYFDQHFRTGLLKLIFKIAFHPRVYKNRGVSEDGLRHSRTSRMADFFYGRFRDFCIANLSSTNGYYQFTFFNRILQEKALADYLQGERLETLKSHHNNLRLVKADIRESLQKAQKGYYTKIILSNLSDWLSRKEMSAVLDQIIEISNPGTRVFARYIHAPVVLTEKQSKVLKIKSETAAQLQKKERYPFYSLVPMVL